MTATPRVYQANIKKAAADREIQIASMDDESIFGPVLHRLSFGDAIENDLLTDYRVVVVGVNDASYQEMVKNRELVKTETGIEDDARSFATQVGLSKAVKNYDLKRVITFHSRVNLAKNFAKGVKEFQDYLKPRQRPQGVISYEHVSGVMRTSDRELRLRALGALENEDRYLLSNARCLSEGVDVPALDGVAFVDPRRSEIDIIQAVGRAIRLSEDKEVGTIVIPVFLSDADDPDEVLSASEFDQVWKVVNALRAHDEVLVDEPDELRYQLGKRQKIRLRGGKIIFDLPRTIGNDFIEAFETKLIESTTASWEFWFGLLEVYKEENGDCGPEARATFNGFKLGQWCGHQRTNKNKGKLSQERISRLEDLGFVWDPLEAQWEEGFNALLAYKKEHGHCSPHYKAEFNGFKLGSWCSMQRKNKKNGKLSQERISRLEAIGFVW